MTEVLLGLLVLLGAGLVVLLVWAAREQRIGERAVIVLTLGCAGALVAMLLTDWPTESLAKFWADHSVLASLLSTVLLVGVVFLAFDDAERRKEERIDAAITSTGLGGIVDHVVDVEVALALLGSPQPPDAVRWPRWDDPAGKPLRWLRLERDRLSRTASGGAAADDPRGTTVALKALPASEWRVLLADQCVRRLLAAVRDWAPVIQTSRNGTVLLIALSELRRDLMKLSAALTREDVATANALVGDLRVRCRLMAYLFETLSEAEPHREEVLATFAPLPAEAQGSWALDAKQRKYLSRDWSGVLEDCERELRDR